jgi:hypothetical protein
MQPEQSKLLTSNQGKSSTSMVTRNIYACQAMAVRRFAAREMLCPSGLRGIAYFKPRRAG